MILLLLLSPLLLLLPFSFTCMKMFLCLGDIVVREQFCPQLLRFSSEALELFIHLMMLRTKGKEEEGGGGG